MKKIICSISVLLCLILPFTLVSINAEDMNNHASHYVVDYDSGRVLSSYNENERHEIASMVKIMTLNVVFDAIDRGDISLNDDVTISRHAASIGGSELFIDAGAQYSVSDLIKGVVVVSANDAATALSEYIANNEDNFVDLMNDYAKKWNMENTRFVNVTGLPKDGQYSSAKDVTIMMKHLLSHKEFYNYSKIWTEDYKHPSGRITNLTNTNKLVRFYDGCDAGKTGYTEKAGFCLSTTAVRDDMRIISTVLGAENSKSRFKISSDLMNNAFQDYSYQVLKHHGDKIENNIVVKNGKSKHIDITFENDVKQLMCRDNKEKIEIEYDLPDSIKAPVKKGDIVGKCYIVLGGERTATINIVSMEEIKKTSIFGNIGDLIRN